MSVAFPHNPLTIHRSKTLQSSLFHKNRIKIATFSNFSKLCVRRLGGAERNLIRWKIEVFPSGEFIGGNLQKKVTDELSLDAFLSMAELLFIIPPTLYTIMHALSFLLPNAFKPLNLSLGSKSFSWHIFLLFCSVATGSLIRRRQWARVCRASEDGSGVNLLARIEKVEKDLKSSASIIRALSRQVEKLGIRFRVTRKAIKEPITETAALAHKNSEATRTLALQEDILEKELGEVQKVLLAMQEQQQKQLELILAIGKAGGLFESKSESSSKTQKSTINDNNQIPKNTEIKTGQTQQI